ncbi:MAG TPA: hypothetical protein VJP89_08225 [Pyrinomonadaceae bacterium]|nr:hypothetical protein [Pyrinomonadaceae bacterium]
MADPQTLERFLKGYKGYVETVLVPTRLEVKELFGEWEQSAHWDAVDANNRRPTPSPVQKVYSRIKRPESVVDKIQRHPGFFVNGLTDESFERMNDTLGVRVVLYFLRHLPAIDREIRNHKNLEVSEVYRPKAYLNADLAARLSLNHLNPVQKESGYASLHYILRLRESSVPADVRPWFELQVRTLTEHTWGEIEHILGYKPDKRTSFAVRKQFQIISKLLEAIDEHFNFLFEELLRFQVEVEYVDADPLNAENLPAVLADLGLSCAQREIDGLLKLLVSRGVNSVRDLRGVATARTREIVWSTYYAHKGQPPNNFEAVASLAAVLGCDDESEKVQRVKAQIEFLNVWEELKKAGTV